MGEPNVRMQWRVRELEALLESASEQVLEIVAAITEEHAEEIVEVFYSQLLAHEDARRFLTHELVQERLRQSLAHWLRTVLVRGADETTASAQELVRRMYDIGMVHARINIPISLLNDGLRIIKKELARTILAGEWDRWTTADALLLSFDLLDLAVESMNDSYVSDLMSGVRQSQSLRIFMAGQSLALECERLRSSLFSWHRNAVLALVDPASGGRVSPLQASDFGLWLHHKALLLLGEAPQVGVLQRGAAEVDRQLQQIDRSPAVHSQVREQLEALSQRVDELAYVLESMVDRAMEVESSRDPLTRLLSRRFLPSIMQQEVALSIREGKRFAALVADIDHFKRINDNHGHQAGDIVLAAIANVLLTNTRASDFVFRFGGEEFVIVLTEVGVEVATAKAEQIRRATAALRLQGLQGEEILVTVSIGVACHDGHPDYEQVLRAADRALYRAKELGRNRVFTAGS